MNNLSSHTGNIIIFMGVTSNTFKTNNYNEMKKITVLKETGK
jgi:hypothetical protein